MQHEHGVQGTSETKRMTQIQFKKIKMKQTRDEPKTMNVVIVYRKCVCHSPSVSPNWSDGDFVFIVFVVN